MKLGKICVYLVATAWMLSAIGDSCSAAYVIYTSRAAFDAAAAAAGLATADEDLATDPGSSFTLSTPAGSVTLTPSGGSYDATSGSYADSPSGSSISSNLTFSAAVTGGVVGIGFESAGGVTSEFGGSASIQHIVAANSNSTGNNGQNSGAGFVGLLSTTGDIMTNISTLQASLRGGGPSSLSAIVTADNFVIATVPEPSSFLLFACVGLGIAGRSWFRRRSLADFRSLG